MTVRASSGANANDHPAFGIEAGARYDRGVMAGLLDRWKATLSTLTSIEVLALVVLELIGPAPAGSPPWVVSALVAFLGLILPSFLIGVVFLGVATRAVRRRAGKP